MIVETKNLTYRNLIKHLMDLPPQRLDDTVTVLDIVNGEFFAAKNFAIADEYDVLDEGHFYITEQD